MAGTLSAYCFQQMAFFCRLHYHLATLFCLADQAECSHLQETWAVGHVVCHDLRASTAHHCSQTLEMRVTDGGHDGQ